ncbi:MAG: molybdate ABC transporter substrate-binding protein [Pseudomonadota bacterium]
MSQIRSYLRALGYALLAAMLCIAPARASDLTIFAAASLKEALEEVTALWNAEGGEPARISFAGSAALARQVAQGAPADVFISANTAWMTYLAEDGAIAAETHRDLLANRLVLIAPSEAAQPASVLYEPPTLSTGTAAAFFHRLGDGRLAMAFVDAVPAGIYGKAALEALDLWPRLSPSVVQTDNVRTALALVARGETPLGIVYATDALAEPRVTVLARFPEESHPPITYPVAAIAGRETRAAPFLSFLSTEPARATFARHGFTPLL